MVSVNVKKNEKLAGDVMAFAVQDADASLRPTLQWLYGLFAKYNQAYFLNRLPVPYILIGDVHDGYARYSEVGCAGWAHQITVKRTVIDGTHKHMLHGNGDPNGLKLFQADVLLHACLDFYMAAVLNDPDPNEKGHGIPFADEANRIGRQMNPALPTVGPSRTALRNGTNRMMSRFDFTPPCGEWPWVVRPAGYYRGAWAMPTRTPKGKAARLMAGLPAAAPAPAATPANIAALQAEVARLKTDLALAEADRDAAQLSVTSGADMTLLPDAALTADVVRALKKVRPALLALSGDDPVTAKRRASLVNDAVRPVLADAGKLMALNLLARSAGHALTAKATTGLSAHWAWDRLGHYMTTEYGTAGAYTGWAIDTWKAALK